MSFFVVQPVTSVQGSIFLPSDKSIAIRAVIISAITRGRTTINNFPSNKDCLYAVQTLRKLGIRIKKRKNNTIDIWGRGLFGLRKPSSEIFVGDSGTTLRLILGVLAGQDFPVKLTAGVSLTQRPMLRVTAPLRMMGAAITARISPSTQHEEFPPIIIRGTTLRPITYKLPVASAQVKSAILLAALYAPGKTKVIEPLKTRDHTERMLKLFHSSIKLTQNEIVITGSPKLSSPGKIHIPGDISSASFFIVLATIFPGAELLIREVGLNPTRAGAIRVLRRMGAKIKITPARFRIANFEPLVDLKVKSARLKATIVKTEEIPSLIDELPILMVASCFAEGLTTFKGVQELRLKESDRIKAMSANLKKMGADIQTIRQGKREDIRIKGRQGLKAATVKSFADHRIAMSLIIAGLNACGKTKIDDIGCIVKSFPDFLRILRKVAK